jgi:tetratricopeptide (TPR) repeat protein
MRGRAVDAESAARIQARSNGHPLFTAHLAGQPADAGMPRELAELLERRLDGLGPDASRVVAALGVADRECTVDVLGASTGLSQDLLVPALHELTARRLLREQRDEDGTALGHPLLAEAARRRLLSVERAAWHRAVAQALATDTRADAAEVAEHWRQAGALPEELRWREAAARQAQARTAPDAEAHQWLRALEIHADHPDLELDAHAARVAAFDALELSGNLAEALVVARAGVEHLDELDDLAAAQMLRRLAMVEEWISDDTSLGLELVDRALGLLWPHGASTELVQALDTRANQLMDLGRYDEALEALDQALEACKTLGDHEVFYGTSATLGWCQAYLGDLPRALATFERGRARVPRPTGPRREAYVAMSHTDALIQHRRPAEEVAAAAQRAIDVGREWGLDFHLLTLTRANVVEALVKTGRVAEAAEVLRTIEIAEDYDHWPVAWMSSQVAVAQGRVREGLETIRSLEVTGTTPENILHRAHLVAVAHLWLGEPREAWDTLASALDAALDHPAVARSCQPFVVLARAGADMSERDASIARETLAALHELRGRASLDPLGPGSMPVVREACTRVWDAELARIQGRDSTDQWVAAARSWDHVRAPHDAAYCRWRAAQAALREGQGTLAARLLKRAAADAREHVPLSRAIAETVVVTR